MLSFSDITFGSKIGEEMMDVLKDLSNATNEIMIKKLQGLKIWVRIQAGWLFRLRAFHNHLRS